MPHKAAKVIEKYAQNFHSKHFAKEKLSAYAINASKEGNGPASTAVYFLSYQNRNQRRLIYIEYGNNDGFPAELSIMTPMGRKPLEKAKNEAELKKLLNSLPNDPDYQQAMELLKPTA